MKSTGSILNSVKHSVSQIIIWFLSSIIFLISSFNLSAQNTLALWNFNGPNAATVPGGGGNPTPVMGAGTASLTGGTTGNFFNGTDFGGSSDPIVTTPPNYAWGIANFPSQSTNNGTAGVSFAISTLGHENIKFYYDVRGSATAASRWLQYEYTTNAGVTWEIYGDNGGSLTPGEVWFNQIEIDLSAIPEVNNNPNFGFRLVSIFSPVAFNPGNPNVDYGPDEAYHRLSVDGSPLGAYAPSGTWRFDMVRLTGTCINYEIEIIADETVICNGEAVTLTAFGGENYEWSTGATGNSITVNPTMTTTYTVTSNINGCEAEEEITITVQPGNNNPVNISIPQTNFCATDPPIALNNVQDGITGVWTLLGNPVTTFDPAGLSGNYDLLFTPNPGQCPTPNSIQVTVTPGPTVNPVTNQEVCAGEEISITFSSTPAGAQFNGTNTNPAIGVPATLTNVTGLNFTAPNVASVQTGTITIAGNSGGCTGPNITFDITINPSITLSDPFSGNNDVCGTVTNFPLPNPIQGISGTWSGMGVTGNNFNAVGQSGSVGLTFTPAAGACATILNTSLDIVNAIVPTFSLPTTLCAGADPLPLPTTSINNITGSWSGPGVINNTFNPTGLNGVTVLDFVPNPGQCAVETDDQITITPAIIPNFNPFPPLCSNDDPFNLPPTSINGVVGTWSGQGVINNVFNPSGLSGSILLTFTRDPGLCAENAVRSIVVNAAPNATVSSNSPVCAGNSLQLSSGGGNTYSWSGPNGFSSNIQNPIVNPVGTAASGTYTVTVTNAAQCSSETTTNVVVSPGFSANLVLLQEPNCNGDNSGSMNINIQGNPTGNLTSNWVSPLGMNLGSSGPFTGLPAGNYSVTLTDQNQCEATANLTINQPSTISSNCSGIDESGPSANDGVIDVVVSGGIPQYNINISPENAAPFFQVGPGTYSFNNLPPGNYAITTTDQNGCTQTCNQTINGADCPDIDIIILDQVNPLCSNSNDGFIQIQVLNAEEPISYQWTPNVSTESFAFGLSGGSYNVQVTDANDCVAQITVPLVAPGAISINCSQLSEASGPQQNDGVGQINILGGVSPYLIIEFDGPSNPATTMLNAGNNNLNNLLPGIYSFTISDNNGCETTCGFTIEFDSDCLLEASIEEVNAILCNGDATGTLVVSAQNGSGSYSYEWIESGSGQTNATLDNLVGGTYSVTVTDLTTLCTAEASFTLQEPTLLQINCAATDISSAGEEDGQINTNISGGTSPWQINWTGPANGDEEVTMAGSFNILGLPAGTYTVIITDGNGCTATCEVTINSPGCDDLLLVMEAIGLTCVEANNGSITTTISNANGTVTYTWSGPTDIPAGTENPTGLSQGLYTLIIEDELGCIRNQSILVPAPLELILSSCGSIPANIGESNGAIIVNFVGGTGPFEIQYGGPMSGTQTEENSGVYDISGLPSGMYDITVTDVNGCETQCEVVILEISDCDLEISCLPSAETAPGADDGEVLINISPNDITVIISYEDQDGELVQIGPIDITDSYTIPSLSPGTYEITVEHEDCNEVCTFEIEAASCDLEVSCNVLNNESTPDANDGLVQINIEPGNQQVTVTYTDPEGTEVIIGPELVESIITLQDLMPGDYEVSIDNGICVQTCEFTIQEGSTGCNFEVNIEITAEIQCHGDANAGFNVTLSGNFQDPVFVLWFGPPTAIEARVGQFDNLPPGLYRIQVNDSAGCSASAQVTITQPPLLVLDCESLANGTIGRLSWTGGVPGYTFNLVNENQDTIRNDAPLMQTFIEFTDLEPGVYEAFIIDDNGCVSESCSFEILPSDCMFSAELNQIDEIVCFGDASASLIVNLTGGTAPFNYEWSGPAAIGNINNPSDLPAGIYSVTITDAEDCETVATLQINQPEELTLTGCQQLQEASGPNEEDGSARVNFRGGTSPYTIQRTGPLTELTLGDVTGISFTASGLEPGLHIFTVTDANGCQATCEVLITFEEVPCSLAITEVTIGGITCPGDSDGFIEVLAISTDPMSEPITYSWSNGATGNRIDNLPSGTYTVTVIDALGCKAETDVTILGIDPFDLDYILLQGDCNNPLATLELINLSGGTPGYSLSLEGENYAVPPVPQSISIEPDQLVDRNLDVFITDANGCEIGFEVTISPVRPLIVPPLPDRNVERGELLTISNLTFNRDPDEVSISLFFEGVVICDDCTTLEFIPILPGTVTIIVTDEDGCSVQISFEIFMEELTKDVYVPTAFTPNGDNINDTFRPYDNGAVTVVLYFQIYDRWGNLIYQAENESLDNLTGWDGTLRGQLLDPGSYVYSLQVEFFDGTTGKYAGEVALIR